MARFSILARIVQVSPGDHVVTVSAVSDEVAETELRQDMVSTPAEARERRDYLIMSLATELRAKGQEAKEVIE